MMKTLLAVLTLTLLPGFSVGQNRAAGPAAATPGVIQIRFSRGQAITGVSPSAVIFLPFQCTADGSVFIESPGFDYMSRLLTSVSPSGEARVFRVDQVPDLYDIREAGHYVTDSKVLFLVEAAAENKPRKFTIVSAAGEKQEQSGNSAEHKFYVLAFDRKGNYQRKTAIDDDTLAVQQIGEFSSGTFLAYGYDKTSHEPRLALLNDDGTVLKYLQVSKADVPDSAGHSIGGKGPAMYLSVIQLVPAGESIIVAQSNSEFPLLEVNQAGGVREIRPKFPKGEVTDLVIPSDEGLYASVAIRTGAPAPSSLNTVYKISSEDGAITRQFELSPDATGGVACVYDNKFLSFEHGEGALIPLIGALNYP